MVEVKLCQESLAIEEGALLTQVKVKFYAISPTQQLELPFDLRNENLNTLVHVMYLFMQSHTVANKIDTGWCAAVL